MLWQSILLQENSSIQDSWVQAPRSGTTLMSVMAMMILKTESVQVKCLFNICYVFNSK